MTVNRTRIAQTTTEVKKEFKKNGQRLQESELRRLQRSVDLESRAVRIHEQEERRRAAKKKREEKERKEQEARRQLGVGLATQMVGYSHTQAQLKSGMEAFLGLKGKKAQNTDSLQAEVNNKLSAIAQKVDAKTPEKNAAGNLAKEASTPSKQPWEPVESDSFGLDSLGSQIGGEESMLENDLDDISLIQVHERPAPCAIAVPPEPTERMIAKANVADHSDFSRVHGPVNKVLEGLLEELPGPLIELLSIDVSTNEPAWAPPSSLLYKLNPAGIPPHRLRIKIGCTVCLLDPSETHNSNPFPHSHLRILKAEKESLRCVYLDGPAKETKRTLTRIPYRAYYRNDKRFAYQRLQFPVRVSTDLTPPRQSMAAASKSTSKQNPAYEVSGLPVSRAGIVLATPARENIDLISSDGWEDFLDSGTQIARELSPEAKSGEAATEISTAQGPQSIAMVVPNSCTNAQPIVQKAPPPRGFPTLQPFAPPTPQGTSKGSTKHSGVFDEFGLSTQDVISFFEDDD